MEQFRGGLENCGFRIETAFADLCQDNFTVAVAGTLDIMSEMYTKQNDFLYKPVLYKQFLNKVGTTSCQYVAELYSHNGLDLHTYSVSSPIVAPSLIVPPPHYFSTYDMLKNYIFLI